MYSLGSFCYVVSRDREAILKQLSFLRQRPGLRHIEIWLECAEWTADDSLWFKKESAGIEIIVHAPFINLSLVSPHQGIARASVEALGQALDLSLAMGAKVFTFHFGRRPAFLSEERALAISSPYLRELLNYAAGKIRLSAENLPASGGSSPGYPSDLPQLGLLLKNFTELFATVDIGHCLKNKDLPYDSFFKKFASRIADIHLHNAVYGGKDHFSLKKPGDLALGDFLGLLQEIKYRGYLTLELFKEAEVAESWDELLANLPKE